jgi:hypothetical protein
MDTRFWGPSGWRLLHTITFAYNPIDKPNIKRLFETLPYVLPCKYCRKSLSEYMEYFPLEPALQSRETLTRWLWKIHNEVNSKLRTQGLKRVEDPSFKDVEDFYTDILETGCSRTEFPGWDFLFSIADLHPFSRSSRKSVPISGAPICQTIEEKNKWNCLEPEERLPMYIDFLKAVGKTLPFKEWRESWSTNKMPETLTTRDLTMKWLWKVRCTMETDLELLNKCKFSHLCKTLELYRSDCTKSTKGKTCRKRRKD